MNDTTLFVYGTLKRGNRNHSLLEKSEFVGSASTKGSLYDTGPYPIMVPTITGIVFGEVYKINYDLLTELDEHEGVPYNIYKRISRNVIVLSTKEVLRAYVYVQPSSNVIGMQEVVSGLWVPNNNIYPLEAA